MPVNKMLLYSTSLLIVICVAVALEIAAFSVAAMSAYMGSSAASKVSEAQSRMNEDAQAALNILSQQLRMAGANPVQANRPVEFRHNPVFNPSYSPYGTTPFTTSPGTFTLSKFAIRGCDGTFTNITASAATTLDSLTCGAGTTTLPDSVAINYEADPYNTEATSTGQATDCVGSALSTITATMPTGGSTTASYTLADNRFYIGNSSTNIPSLYCKGSSSATQPLVENVEDMQFTYGTMGSTASGTTATVAGYLSAYDVINESSLALLANDDTRWGKVIAVRICIIVRSESAAAPDAVSARYTKCDGNVDTTKTDLRLRRAYSTTVVLRNRKP